VDVSRDMKKGWRIGFTESVYNLIGKVGQIWIICSRSGMVVNRVREIGRGGGARSSRVWAGRVPEI
jgi:hypothetical protein